MVMAPAFARAASSTTAAISTGMATRKKPAIGLELYSVRGELQKDLPHTLRTVAKQGYEVVEFFSPYVSWTFPYAKEVRTQLDDLGMRCYSTHNGAASLTDAGTMAKTIELNQILGSRYIIAASPPRGVTGLDGWKRVCEQFSAATEQLKPHGLAPGYHNHATEWKPVQEGGPRIMDTLAANTPADFALQLDVGTAVEAGADPVAWIRANPGRIKSVHLKDWTPGTKAEEKSYRVLFGEGVAPWKEIIAAAEAVGGVEFYLLEQEGCRYSEFETAERCLANWKKMRGTR
jgi:sugar phosphate isomerase/epimerase